MSASKQSLWPRFESRMDVWKHLESTRRWIFYGYIVTPKQLREWLATRAPDRIDKQVDVSELASEANAVIANMGIPTRVVALRRKGDWRYMLVCWTRRVPNDVAEVPPAPFEEPKYQKMKRFWRAKMQSNWIDASRYQRVQDPHEGLNAYKIPFLMSAEDRGHADEEYEMLEYGYEG